MTMAKADIIKKIAESVLNGDKDHARDIIISDYPFEEKKISGRTYSIAQKMEQFMKDGFIDRYSGERLVNPGILKVLSIYYPEEFPYHPHGKMTKCHMAFWELFPTIDHILPIACGGKDEPENWVTTSMINNSIKSNWTLEQLRWKIEPAGKLEDWDGVTLEFVEAVNADTELLNDNYIKRWYNGSQKYYKDLKDLKSRF